MLTKEERRDKEAERTYVVSNSVMLRSTQMAGVEYNVLDRVYYGGEVITYDRSGEWASVKAHDKEGFIHSDYLLAKPDFELLNGVWADADALQCVFTAKCRLAVLDYLKSKNLKTGSSGWQIYTMKKGMKPNTIAFPRLYDSNSKFTDFIFVIKNNATSARKVVCYSFDDETAAPKFRFDTDAPENGNITEAKWQGKSVKISFDNGEAAYFRY